jgi:hypothetical protein
MTDQRFVGITQLGLTWVGRDWENTEARPYLFVSRKGEHPFILIQQNLHELNDFCVTLFHAMKARAALEPTKEVLIDEARNKAEDPYHYVYVGHSLQFSYGVEDLGRMFCPASALIMLYANLIRSLHMIADYYGEKHYKSWCTTRDNRGVELRQLVTLLEKISNEKLEYFFEQPRVRVIIDDNMRILRNDFLHGNWESVEKRLVGINIQICFQVVSDILYFLEEKFDSDRLFKDCKYPVLQL